MYCVHICTTRCDIENDLQSTNSHEIDTWQSSSTKDDRDMYQSSSAKHDRDILSIIKSISAILTVLDTCYSESPNDSSSTDRVNSGTMTDCKF